MNETPPDDPTVAARHSMLLRLLLSPPVIVAALLVAALLLVVSLTPAVQAAQVMLGSSEVLSVICDGPQLNVERLASERLTLTCRGERERPAARPAEPYSEPPPTPTPHPGIQPFAGAPACQATGLAHDDSAWHGIWDYERGCHWDHTHNDDPAELDAIFGPWPFDSTISYPHQTPHENESKHAGYKWYTLNTHGECVKERQLNGMNGCVVAMRLQYHVVGSELGLKTRFHSYYGQVLVRNPDGTLGMVSTGGWSDFGLLHNPYKQTRCTQDSDADLVHSLSVPPYRATHQIEGVVSWNNGTNGSNHFNPYNRILSFDWFDFDVWTWEPDCSSYDDQDFDWICPDLDRCDNNHSLTRFYEIVVTIPPELHSRDKVNFVGYTNREGFVVDSCRAPALDCVPLIVENVDATTGHAFRVTIGGRLNAPDLQPVDRYSKDYDLSPEGEWWIKYPN